jgi:hypothetical protein
VPAAADCPITAPLVIEETQRGVVGPAGTAWAIAPDCSFTVRDVGPMPGEPRAGQLTPAQRGSLRSLLARTAPGAFPVRMGGPPEVNFRTVKLTYEGRTSELVLPPDRSEAGGLPSGSPDIRAFLDFVDAVKALLDTPG